MKKKQVIFNREIVFNRFGQLLLKKRVLFRNMTKYYRFILQRS
jgi:hypothetical protein